RNPTKAEAQGLGIFQKRRTTSLGGPAHFVWSLHPQTQGVLRTCVRNASFSPHKLKCLACNRTIHLSRGMPFKAPSLAGGGLVRCLGRGDDVRLLCGEHPQCNLGVGTVLTCRLPQPSHGFILIHRNSVAIAIAQPKIVLSCGIAFTGRSSNPSGSACTVLWNPAANLRSHTHLKCRRIISIFRPTTQAGELIAAQGPYGVL